MRMSVLMILVAALPLAAQKDLDEQVKRARQREAQHAQDEAERVKERVKENTKRIQQEFQWQGRVSADHISEVEIERIKEQAREMAEKARTDAETFAWQIKPRIADLEEFKLKAQEMALNVKIAMPFAFQGRFATEAAQREENFYRRGQSAQDEREWERAAQAFSTAASFNGPRADGALYWKAYSLNKLGRRDEALAALVELQKTYASSKWLNDAKVLEVEVKQSAGRPVSPEQENDEELKIYAINALVHTDPERAMPLLEKILATSSSPRLKDRALFVLAQTRVPRAIELLTKMAQGGVNPDLQRKAVQYLGDAAGKSAIPALAEVYASSNDFALKRAILNVYSRNKDKERLLAAATSENSPDLRREAIRMLGNAGGYDELVKLYGSTQAAESKVEIIRSLGGRGGADKLQEIIKQERDTKLRVEAIRRLGNDDNIQTGELLVGIYSSESDPALRKAVISALGGQNNGKALVELARKESDLQLKKSMIERLSNMHSKEANDYLMEILSK
jgi:HEAT repeat protein/TolA-binding protein